MAGLSERLCGVQCSDPSLAAALWRSGHLHRTVGLGPQSHPDHGQRPHSHYSLQVRVCACH